MIKEIERDGNFLYLEANDMISKEDMESLSSLIADLRKQNNKVKILGVLNEVKGLTFNGLLADFNFFLKHKDHIERLAIVGNEEYEKAIVEVVSKFGRHKVKYFDISELSKAKDWAKQ